MRALGLICHVESYNHETRAHWKIVPDGSVCNGAELVSPILRGIDGRRQLRLAMRALRNAGATADRSCGLHVHHDANHLTASQLARLITQWSEAQRSIDWLVAPSRRNNTQYCSPLDSYDLRRADRLGQLGDVAVDRDTVSQCMSGDRFRTFNVQSYGRQGTVEIRQHQGTVNAGKALAWVAFGQAMVTRAVAGPADAPADTRALLDDLVAHGLDAGTAAYLEDRAAAFQGDRAAV